MSDSEQRSGIGGLFALGVKRPVGMGMIVAAAVVFGWISLQKLPVDLLPPVNYPSLTVRTTYSGAAPEDVEERVTERLEDMLSTVGHLVNISSSSRAEVSEILMEFEWGSNLPFLIQDVRERLDRVFLPNGVDKPLILRYDPSLDPGIRVALSGGSDLVRLRDIAESEVERQLEGLPGVAAVRVKGGLEDEVHVLIDPQRLALFKVSGEDIRTRLQEENLNVPGGKLEEGSVEYVVRTLNQFRSLEEIEALPIKTVNQTIVKLRDLATVKRANKDRDVIQRVGGEESVEIAVYREAGANIVAVAEEVRVKLFGKPVTMKRGPPKDGRPQAPPTHVASKLPSDVKLTLLSDQSTFIADAISEVNRAAIFGGIFAVLVCYFFLRRFGTTFIIGLAVPISIVATFGAMYSSGVSMNIMSLGGLALGIGMLVDNAIVVLESITRCREEGDSPHRAAIRGVSEVGSAVTASTLTTIAVFAPIIFVEGIAGQTFGDQALTVVASLLISLAVALFFIPGLAARIRLSDSDKGKSTWKKITGELFPHMRSGKFFRNTGLSKSKLLIGLAIAGLAAGGALLAIIIPGMDDEWIKPGTKIEGNWSPVPPEVRETIAAVKLFAYACFIPLAWLVIVPLTTLAARFAFDLFGVAFFYVRAIFAALLAVVWAICWIPAALINLVFRANEAIYPKVLKGAIRAPILVLLLAAAVAYGTFQAAGNMGRELLPEVLQGEFTAELFFPAGTPLTESDRIASSLERSIRKLDGVEETAITSGSDRDTVSTEETGPHTSRISIRLNTSGKDPHALELNAEERIRTLLGKEPALARYNLRRPTLLALNAPLEVDIIGDNLATIGKVARDAEDALSDIPGLVDVRSSLRRGNPEVRITPDREKLARHNLTAAQVANRLRLAVEGETASTFPGRDERIDIRVRADTNALKHIEQLKDLPVNPDADHPLPLSAVADFEIQDGPSDIRHIRGRRAAVLSASLSGFDLGATGEAVEARLQDLPRPPEVSVSVGGQTDEMASALSSLLFALGLAVFLVYAVMAAQFESLLQPFLILFSVPLAAVGAIWAMIVTNTPISVVALLGAVILAGIVVNNAIVLVDRINRNRESGMSVDDAILEGARTRLRPILMTTTTTVLGMLPMTGWIPFLGGQQGAELRTPMALVVISGLISSTLLTLIVIPTGYRLLAKIDRKKVPETSNG
ncbi:MAG: efflux RND transporter permease subunit [Planctomycetes bacterium]|nr:efflux RND transporter permease subunit [Planctomycetota bacterium]MCP4772321.1 efflux RND transporter permease subunit [Planctomycetota bacterium]MCP4861579.1 efflux RND transporter permease subunit [Planctomycetota bacterium]